MSVGGLTPEWPMPPSIRAISSWRGGGVSSGRYASLNLGDHVGDDPQRVAENRTRLHAVAELPSEPKWLAQVHGVAVADLDAELVGVADAAFTRRKGVVCAILTADCLPVLLVSDLADVVGAAHAGWRGLAAGVLEATVAAMDTPPQRLLAWLGPAIGPMHFEVGAEVREALMAQDTGASVAFQSNASGRYMADLVELARRRLRAMGIGRIYGGGECTYSHESRYFSHRRDGNTGRQATLIWRE